MTPAAVMALALLIDAAFGWPAWLYARIGHPVTWLGRLISGLERLWNKGDGARRRTFGGLCTLLVVLTAVVPTAALQNALPDGVTGLVIGAVLAWPLIAARSLWEHVDAVAQPLALGDLAGARQAVSMIVGRDPEQLDNAGVARAALESLAENASDGVVAPLFWGAVFGLPGIAAYKAINTLDSMIGHRNSWYEDFGRIAAQLDDLVNLIPARLTGGAICLAARSRLALKVMRRDARQHRSPNAGWPEAAMAGALGVRLSGPRRYGLAVSQEPWLNGTAPDPGAAELVAGLQLYRRAIALCGLALLLIGVLA